MKAKERWPISYARFAVFISDKNPRGVGVGNCHNTRKRPRTLLPVSQWFLGFLTRGTIHCVKFTCINPFVGSECFGICRVVLSKARIQYRFQHFWTASHLSVSPKTENHKSWALFVIKCDFSKERWLHHERGNFFARNCLPVSLSLLKDVCGIRDRLYRHSGSWMRHYGSCALRFVRHRACQAAHS